LFQRYHVRFEREYTFENLRGGKYRFDFYLPDFNCLVEYDGPQHFNFNKFFYKKRTDYLKAQERDRIKNNYALARGFALYRIPYWEIENITKLDDIFQQKFRVVSQYHNDRIKPKGEV